MGKLELDATVYYMDGNRLVRSRIDGVRRKTKRGILECYTVIIYDVDDKEMRAEDLYTSKTDAFIKLMDVIDFGEKTLAEVNRNHDKLKKVCRYLFPDEYADEISDDDFKMEEEPVRALPQQNKIPY